ILTHGDGTLQILCRSPSRAIVESWSQDYGQSWSPMKKSVLPNNNSELDAVTLDGGRHLLVYNHVRPPKGAERGKTERTPLNVAVSEDGKAWSAALVLGGLKNQPVFLSFGHSVERWDGAYRLYLAARANQVREGRSL